MKFLRLLISGAPVAGVIGSIGLSACTSVPHEAYPTEQGWRLAHVDRVVSAGESVAMLDSSQDCRLQSGHDGAAAVWVLVHVDHPRSISYRIEALASPDMLEHPGQVYFINTRHCDKLQAVVAPS